MLTNDLFAKVKEGLPKEAEVSDIRFEGSDIVIYTKSKEFFTGDTSVVKNLVSALKKRIVLRPDQAICKDMEDAKKEIEKIVPKEAGLKDIEFEPGFSTVTIEAEKPGLVIGKGGELIRELRAKTLWAPIIKRAPAIPSDTVKTLRELVYRESNFRRVFLDKVGRRIHSGWKPTDWITVTGLGAFREVGRSAVLVRTPESRVLMDCGIKPGGSMDFPMLSLPEADPTKLDAVVLSHSHLDHCAMVPFLYEMGCDAPLYCTAPTRDFMVLMCLDFLEIAQREGKPAPYTSKGIKEAVKRCITLEWGQVADITPDIRLTLLNDGHILGGSLIHLHIGNGLHNILYTGDLKFDRTALFDPASTDFARAETIITESTYGAPDALQPRRPQAEAALADAVKRTVERGGKALIPSFAVERAQDAMVILEKSGVTCPVYIDGMIWDATAIHTAYPEYFGRELQREILQKGHNPLVAPMFKRIGSQEERKKILESKEPCAIIATSGMLIGGPSVWWLRNLAEDKKNSLIFIGYQAEGSMGRKIQRGWREVPIEENGKTKALPINLEVTVVEGLSGHSDYKQLINYIGRMNQKPQTIITNHGEESRCLALAQNLHKLYRVETIAPKILETVRLV